MVTTCWKDWFFRPLSKGRLLKGLSQDLCLGLGPLGIVVLLRTLYRLCSAGNWLSFSPHHTAFVGFHCSWDFLLHPLTFLPKPLCLVPFLAPVSDHPIVCHNLTPSWYPLICHLCALPYCNVTDLWNQRVVWGLFSSREIICHRVGPCMLEW